MHDPGQVQTKILHRMRAVTLTVSQGSSPTLRLILKVKDEAGDYVVHDLSPVSGARFIIKGSPDVPDPAPRYITGGGGLTILEPRTAGMVTVAFNAADTTVLGNRFWKLVLDLGGVSDLGGYGRLHIAKA
jgi:hypothetical protein